MRKFLLLSLLFTGPGVHSQKTVFEKSNGKETATYFETIGFYKQLALRSPLIKMRTGGPSDAGYPVDLVLVSGGRDFDPAAWHRRKKVVILVNNGIHPGEPDGIDASMMLTRDIADGKVRLPGNVVLVIIPVYNIGGDLNRSRYSRVNQNGPESYGFRGNGQNLDLNRDFTKCDSKNARSFARIFHFLNPDILVDTHVSDGADYQHTMTLITTQYDKLGATLGGWVKNTFEPALYKGMKEKKWDMVPYVNVEGSDPSEGFTMFYDSPRYSTGYAALFNTIGFMPETHMLKPYAQRVKSTYDLLMTMMEQASLNATDLLAERQKAIENTITRKDFPLAWRSDSSHFRMIPFKGYEAGYRKSEATGLPVRYYDHLRPYSKEVKYYDSYLPENIISKTKAYVIPQGWWAVTDLLRLNGVHMERLKKDTVMEVEAYHIESLRPLARAYEKHHRNSQVVCTLSRAKIPFLKGDYLVRMDQAANRYITEMLEPSGDDSFFSWNFFDAVLQEKEGYSEYRWNDTAVAYLKENPALKARLDDRVRTDSAFAKNAAAQFSFIYKNSPWYEPAHMRYPVYRLEE